ncbi:MAG: DUF2851 family protein, partial [Bacteroidota bacterium]|nr:DUF2851 family protein [Bacteroidota bacterium]
MNEALLSYFWKLQRFRKDTLCTTDGEPISVVYPGLLNQDSGPDFLHARLKIGATLWVGNVELHVKSSDWLKHGHAADPMYDSLILHVVYTSDMPVELPCPELALEPFIDARQIQLAEDWYQSLKPIPCYAQLKRQPERLSVYWKERLLVERLEDKGKRIRAILDASHGDWERVFFEVLAHYFGARVNTLPFEMLARATPFKVIRKLATHREELEALFFGQAGFLEGKDLDGFHHSLKERYRFQRAIHRVEGVSKKHWKFLRLRPANFPTRRLSQLADLMFQHPDLLRRVLAFDDLKFLRNLLRSEAHEYWECHVRFGQMCKPERVVLGQNTADMLLGNALLPFLHVYAEHHAHASLGERVL